MAEHRFFFFTLGLLHWKTNAALCSNFGMQHALITRIGHLLGTRRATMVLLAANALVTMLVMWSTRHTVLSDSWSYIGLAEGMLNNEYSMFWPLDDYYPDTVRTPGFPLLIAAVMGLFGTWKAMVWINVALYVVALGCTLAMIRRLDGRREVSNLFLLVLLPMIYVPFYVSQVYTEIPVLAAISVALYIGMRPGPMRWYDALGLGLLFGFMFQCKPAFLLLPPAYAVLRWWSIKGWSEMRAQVLMLVVFIGTLVPYGLWNLEQHGVFKVTPLEGGAGVMHFGYWSGKLPGYTEKFYWHNFTGDEIIRFTPEEQVPENIAAYEREWVEINERTKHLLTAKDSLMLASRSHMPYPVMSTFNTEYTLLREKLLMERAKEHLLSEPGYNVPHKLYSAVRFWVIGIQRGEFNAASFAGKVRMLYATGITLGTFVLCIVLLVMAFRRRILDLGGSWQPLLFMVYVGTIHIPFAVQARYTVPVRFAMFALMALAIGGLLWGPREKPVERS